MSKSKFGLKIFSPEQVKEWDEFTIQKEPISSDLLMERAAHVFVSEFMTFVSPEAPIAVFCGLGNNGGDGLAIARLLLEKNYSVHVFVLRYEGRSTKDFRIHLQRLEQVLQVEYISSELDYPMVSKGMVLIDAIFGIGLNRPVTGLAEKIIHLINQSRCTIVSVDIASGLLGSSPSLGFAIVQPTYTLTFQSPKLSFLLPQNDVYTGSVKVLDIGLHPEYVETTSSDLIYLQAQEMARWVKIRSKFAHKGHFGHVLLFAGSKGKMGAALLAAKAAMRTGAGLLSLLVEETNVAIVQNGVWEAMCVPYKAEDPSFSLPSHLSYTIGVGPGIGQTDQAKEFLKRLLETSSKPMLIDADALNLLAEHPQLLDKVPPSSILTPHPKEFERLVGKWKDDYDRLEKQMAFSSRYQVYLVLKGAYSSVSTPLGEVYFNSTGNPGMATGGSGDVLSGIITSLLAQQYDPKHAALLGVFLHGLAGDLAAAERGEHSLIASDLIDKIHAAYMKLSQSA
jgi:NAD(P)H-hydrate epimerase